MAGIVGYGAYIPWLRLQRKLIAQSWGIPGAPGEIAVGNFDEDSITMAVEAGRDCIQDDPTGVGGLYFASTSPPYQEKSASTLIAMALDLGEDSATSDFGISLDAGLSALVAAIAAVDAGLKESILVSAAECRKPEPMSALEQTLGDGAAAVLVGKDNVVAEIKGTYSHYNEILGSWRTQKDDRIREFNPRFYASKGYVPDMVSALKGAIETFGVSLDEINKLVYSAPDFRSHGQVAKALGIKQPEKVQDALFASVGGCGCAQPLMMLSAALETAEPGDKILLAGSGDAYDVVLLEVTPKIKKLAPRRGVSGHLGSKQDLESYAKFLQFKDQLNLEKFEAGSSPILMWRERKTIYSLYGKKCKKCGTVYFPPYRICPECRAYEQNEDYRLARKGILFDFIHDYLFPSENPPTTLTITDLEGGGRIFSQMTDRVADEVKLDMEVELVFRKIHEGEKFHNYYWKTRPVR